MKNLLNLYTEELRERPVPYGFNLLLGAALAVAVLMLLLGLATQHRLGGLDTEHQAQQVRQQALNSSIAALESQQAKQDQLESMRREMALLQQDIQGRERALIELKGYIQRPAEGFSRVLHGLAEASGHGVWLTHIHLAAAPAEPGLADVRLIGKMRQAEQLPHYLDALAATEALSGQGFNSMQARRPEASAGGGQVAVVEDDVITFMISSRADDETLQGGGR